MDLLAQRHDLGPPQSADDKVRELFARAVKPDSSVAAATNDETVRGIQVVSDARDRLSSVAPEAASLISVQKVEVPDIVAHMGPQEALIDYFMQGEDQYAFVLNARGITGYRLPAKGLEDDVKAFRAAIDQRSPAASESGRRLYDRLIRPLQDNLQGQSVVIAPHGILHYLPFAALMDGQDYLVDRFSIRLIPSANTLVYLRSTQQKKLGKLLALGNPDLGSAHWICPTPRRKR